MPTLPKCLTMAAVALLSVLPAGAAPERPPEPAGDAAETRLYGAEAALCLVRARAAVDKGIRDLHALLRTPLPKGKTLLEEWTALAGAVCQDVDLYCRSALDAARDARKEKKCQAADADMDKLKSVVNGTIECMNWVFRKKGLEVAAAMDSVIRSAGILTGLRWSLPGIYDRLKADLDYASDVATSVHKDLAAGDMTDSDLDECIRGMEIARRSVQAVKAVGMMRRTTLGALLKALAPDVTLANFRKAADGWVPADEGEGTLIGAECLGLVRAWPAELEGTISGRYAEIHQIGFNNAKQFIEGTFHQWDLFKNTRLEDLDKALDPYVAELKAAQEARKAYEQSQRDIDDADDANDTAAAEVRRKADETGKRVESLADRIKNMRVQLLYESDRRRYQELYKRSSDNWVEWKKLDTELGTLEKELADLRKQKVPSGRSPEATQSTLKRISDASALSQKIKRVKSRMAEVEAEGEELDEEEDELRSRMRGE